MQVDGKPGYPDWRCAALCPAADGGQISGDEESRSRFVVETIPRLGLCVLGWCYFVSRCRCCDAAGKGDRAVGKEAQEGVQVFLRLAREL